MAKTALVTGASQGIGACIAKTLAAEGFNVAINCRSEQELENGGREVEAACRALGVEAECFICDVSDFTACGESIGALWQHRRAGQQRRHHPRRAAGADDRGAV